MKKKTSIIYTKVVQSLFSAIKQMPKENHVLFCFFVFCVVLFCIVGGTRVMLPGWPTLHHFIQL